MLIGEIILGRWEVLEPVAVGSQAEVAIALDRHTGNKVVIKRMSASPDSGRYHSELARFRRAASIRIDHPNILDPLEYAEGNGEVYLVMPFIEGASLASLQTRAGGRFTPEHTASILRQIAEGLAALHAKGIVHRDLKPANIMIQDDGHVFIIDLGICRILGETTITDGCKFIGTPPFASPEQIRDSRQAGLRADLYALGGIGYLMLTGHFPVPGQTDQELVDNTLRLVPQSLQGYGFGIPAWLDHVCMKLLAKQPEDRHQSAEEVIRALDAGELGCSDTQFCPQCGCKSHHTARFCPACGLPQGSPDCAGHFCLACRHALSGEHRCPGCHRLFSKANPRFELTDGQVCCIPEGIFSAGRDQIAPGNRYMSRIQIGVVAINGDVLVENANANNPTTVNGQPAAGPVLLKPGDTLSLGMTSAVYQSH